MIIFIILHVWQNTELMKIKMEFRKRATVEKNLIKENDRLLYEIEKYRRYDRMQKYAEERGFKRIEPGDFVVLEAGKKNEQ